MLRSFINLPLHPSQCATCPNYERAARPFTRVPKAVTSWNPFDDYPRGFKPTKEFCNINLLHHLDHAEHAYKLEMTALISRLLWKEGEGIANKKAFMKFLKYHGIPSQAVFGTSIYFPKYKAPGNSRVVFHDDNYATVHPFGETFTVEVRFYHSRDFYRRLARYLDLPYLPITDLD